MTHVHCGERGRDHRRAHQLFDLRGGPRRARRLLGPDLPGLRADGQSAVGADFAAGRHAAHGPGPGRLLRTAAAAAAASGAAGGAGAGPGLLPFLRRGAVSAGHGAGGRQAAAFHAAPGAAGHGTVVPPLRRPCPPPGRGRAGPPGGEPGPDAPSPGPAAEKNSDFFQKGLFFFAELVYNNRQTTEKTPLPGNDTPGGGKGDAL